MRLKKLVLQGFKSFADRTEFVFDSPITGIVGPNGCGKSNVVDAFKWVLGEQSAKSLRGDAMLDVIFNGSAARKAAGMAEVTLVFENPLRDDGTRMLAVDADEVSVGRRLFRDGTSEYQLNNQNGRLRDIREMFLDTGVGADAYSVIEQGKVAAMLEANPEQRRAIFEEAAGISKYKLKKKETQRKLEKVEQNLLRVTDIVEEVDRRLRSVKLQAGKARNYREYQSRLTDLRMTHSLHEFHQMQARDAELSTRLEAGRFAVDDAATDLQRAETAAETDRQNLDSATQRRQAMEYDVVQLRARSEAAVQKQAYALQQIAQTDELLGGLTDDRDANETRLGNTIQRLDDVSAAFASLTEDVGTRQRAISDRQQTFRQYELDVNRLNQEAETEKRAVLELMRQSARVGSRLGAIEIEQRNIEAHQQRLGDRRRVVVDQCEELDRQRQQRQSALDAVMADVAGQQHALDAARAAATALNQQIAQLADSLGAAREHRSGLLSRQKLLSDLESRLEGIGSGAQHVLRNREAFPFIRGLVADVLRVDVEHAHVVEAALDGRDQWLVAGDSSSMIAAADAMAVLEGRVHVLASDVLRQADPAGSTSAFDWNSQPQRLRLAVDLVRFHPADSAIAGHLLGTTAVVDSLTDAESLRRNGPAGWRYVTPRGEVLEADGTLRAGPMTGTTGLLSRHAELDALTLQIDEVDGRITAIAGQLDQGNAAAKELESRQNDARTALYQSNTARVELTTQIAELGDRSQALKRERPLLEQELTNLLDAAGRLVAEVSELVDRREGLEADQAARTATIDQTNEALARITGELRNANDELTELRIALGQTVEKQLAARQDADRLSQSRQELAQQAERIVRSIEAAEARKHDAVNDEQAARRDQASLAEQLTSITVKVEGVAAEVQTLRASVAERNAAVHALREAHAAAEQALHAAELAHGELRVRLESMIARCTEEMEVDLPARYAALSEPDEQGNAGPGYQAPEADWDAIADEIRQLRDRIQRLGNVNLEAIGEQDELEQRQQFLAIQVNDLTGSRRQLCDLIAEINVESRARFEQTLNAVREHFQAMFRKLFGGGKADIYLETELENVRPAEPIVGPDGQMIVPENKKLDPLDAGIEIIARPPGKQPATISQLSGGEKTMTCIALLMSIFKSKPSPFCILDEVDAALDEANNQRFNLIVQEFLDRSQFILITHSKRTMQIADVLLGVTMQEQGVSRKVSVKFDQIGAGGEIDAEAAAA